MAHRESDSADGSTCPWVVQDGHVLYAAVSTPVVDPHQIAYSQP